MNKTLSLVLLFITFTLSQNLTWKVEGRMPIPVSGGRAVVKDSLIYIIGGFSDSLKRRVEYIQEYNPNSKQWRGVGTMRLRRENFYASVLNDSLFFVFGGVAGLTQFKRWIEAWKTPNSTYFFSENPNFDRRFFTAQVVGSIVHIFGGVGQGTDKKKFLGTSQNLMNPNTPYYLSYNLLTKQTVFSSNGIYPPNSSPSGQMSARIGAKIYIFGGVNFGISDEVVVFNTLTNSFTKFSRKMTRARAGGEAIKFGENKILLIGGFNEGNPALRKTEIYTFFENDFTVEDGPDLVYPRKDVAVVEYKNSIYLFGGFSSNPQQVVPFFEKLEVVSDLKSDEVIINDFEVSENYPNPFNPNTSFKIKLPHNSEIKVEVYNVLGKKVNLLISDEFKEGVYEIHWNGKDMGGVDLPSGVYFLRVNSQRFNVTRKMVLLR